MKKSPQHLHPIILASFVGVAACLLLTTSAQASTATGLYWDADGVGASGTNTSLGGTGAWDSTSALWWNPTTSTYNTWNSAGGTTGSIAYLKGTAGTVTIAAGGVTVGSDLDVSNKAVNAAVTVTASGYTLTGGSLTYDGAGSVIDSIIYHLTTSGNLTLNNDTVVKTYAPTATATAYTKFIVADSGTTTVTVNGNIGLGSTETAGTKFLEFKGANAGTTIEVKGTIKDYASTGSGAKLAVTTADFGSNQILKLSGTNTYSGGTQIRGGTVIASNDSAVGTGTIMFSTQYGAFLTSAPMTISNPITIGAAGTSTGAALGTNSAGVTNFTGSITRTNSSDVDSLAFTAVTGGTVIYSGEIIDKTTGHVQSVIKIGEGVVNLSRSGGSTGTYAYGGGTYINNGTLLVNNTSGSATGTGAVKVNSLAASSTAYSGGAYRSYTLTVADTTGLTVGQSVTGTNIAAGTYITAILNSTQINLSSTPLNGGYTGTLNFGTSSGTLGGTGIISGTTTVSSGATIAPGNFSNGTLTLGGGLNLQGTYAWEINANSESTGFDKITLTAGDLTLGAASTLDISALAGVDFANDFWKTSHNWTVIENTGTGAINGTFSSLTGLTSNAEGAFTLNYGTGSGADATLSWVAVPEPSTWTFVGLGLGMTFLGMRQRNRRLS